MSDPCSHDSLSNKEDKEREDDVFVFLITDQVMMGVFVCETEMIPCLQFY